MCEGDEVKFISTQGGKKKKKKNRKNFYAKNICLHITDEPIRARQLKMTISKRFYALRWMTHIKWSCHD